MRPAMRIEGSLRAAAARKPLRVVLASGLLSFVLLLGLPWGVGSAQRYGDEHLYLDYGNRIQHGDVPYRDFYVEYPPGALPVFVAPALVDGHETTAFRVLMAALWALASGCACALAVVTRVGRTGVLVAVAACTVFAALFAPLLLNTYDAWPAALVAGSLLALVGRRDGLAGAALGVAIAAKLLPALLLPLAWLAVRRRGGGRRLIGGVLVGGAIVTVPFVLVAPTGLANSLETQLRRGLHVEAVPSTIFLLASRVGATVRTAVEPPGSLNVLGGAATAVALVATLALLLATAAVLRRVALGLHRPQVVLGTAATIVVATLVFGKVLSPQYLTLAVPLVAATGSLPGCALLLAAAGISVSWPLGWATPFDLDDDVWWAIARNGLLVLLLLVAWAAAHRKLPHEDGIEADDHQVPEDDDPDDVAAGRQLVEPRREPHPRQQRGGSGEGPRGGRTAEGDRRYQPDQVLRREHAVERDHAGSRDRDREHEIVGARPGPRAPEEPARERDGGDLQQARECADRVRQAPRQVEGVRRRDDDPGASDTGRAQRAEEACAQALDLQAARELRAQRESQPARREEGERDRDGGAAEQQADEGAPGSGCASDALMPREDGGSEEQGIELRGGTEAQQARPRRRPPADEEEHPDCDECGGPGVEGVQGDRPEEQRREPHADGCGPLASRTTAERAYGEDRRGRGHSEEDDLHELERQRVVVGVGDERRDSQRGERRRRELDEEVAVRDAADCDLLAVLPVEPRVADSVALEDPVRHEGRRGDEDGQADERRDEGGATILDPSSLRPHATTGSRAA